jgi:hypothetical protein
LETGRPRWFAVFNRNGVVFRAADSAGRRARGGAGGAGGAPRPWCRSASRPSTPRPRYPPPDPIRGAPVSLTPNESRLVKTTQGGPVHLLQELLDGLDATRQSQVPVVLRPLCTRGTRGQLTRAAHEVNSHGTHAAAEQRPHRHTRCSGAAPSQTHTLQRSSAGLTRCQPPSRKKQRSSSATLPDAALSSVGLGPLEAGGRAGWPAPSPSNATTAAFT